MDVFLLLFFLVLRESMDNQSLFQYFSFSLDHLSSTVKINGLLDLCPKQSTASMVFDALFFFMPR